LLRPVAEKVLEIHFEGLQRERVVELLGAVKGFLEYKLRVAGRILYYLGGLRMLEAGVRKNNLECNVEVYDINDVLENLHGLREDVKSKYRELLLTINKIIETT
jgi:hypothetical protein